MDIHKKIGNTLIIMFICVNTSSCLSGGTTTSTTNNLPDIVLESVNSSKLPALQGPLVTEYGGEWLIMGGLNNGIHQFAFKYTNPNISVYNPVTQDYYSESLSDTDLPQVVQQQLRSADQVYWRSLDTLYVIGGFYNSPIESNSYTTLDIITTFNVSGMINAIMNHDPHLAQFVHYNTTIPEFKVTGGGLGRIDSKFYLAFGQDCEGNYCDISQVYTNTMVKFSANSNLESITIEDKVSNYHLDSSGFRRRDYNLVPFQIGNKRMLLALGGPFTPGSTAYVWTNGILFDDNLQYNQNYINQQADQYMDANLTMYSDSAKITYVFSLSGLSNLYWAESGLMYDNTTPYGNVLDLITSDESSNVREYANLRPVCSGHPISSCLYTGLDSIFVVADDSYYDNRMVLQLDSLGDSQVLVGYMYGGLISYDQNIFGESNSYASNQVYKVYIKPHPITNSWLDITNLYPGN